MTLARWTREPLVHFLLGGALLFAFFLWQGQPADPASRSISVTREDRAVLALQWEQTMQRPPTDAELDGMVKAYVHEEILYREALRLGLEQDDPVVRKRLANKMDYLASSMVETAPVSAATLQAWYTSHPQRFADDVRYSFDQRYFQQRSAAERALKQIEAGGAVPAGEPISLPPRFTATSRREVSARMGSAFTSTLDGLAEGTGWSGPVASGFGWHLVKLGKRTTSKVPPFAAIREQVEADWRASTEDARRASAYALLRSSYTVHVAR